MLFAVALAWVPGIFGQRRFVGRQDFNQQNFGTGNNVDSLFCGGAQCPVNTKCVLGNDGPVCVPSTGSGQYCATMRCRFGTQCIDTPHGGECVPAKSNQLACSMMFCAQGQICIESTTGPLCVAATSGDRCSMVRCAHGTRCQETSRDAVCVPEQTPESCADILCMHGSTCVDNPGTGATCQPFDKPGTCPRQTLRQGPCVYACIADAGCPASEKCCTTGCGMICVEPMGGGGGFGGGADSCYPPCQPQEQCFPSGGAYQCVPRRGRIKS